ncbi:unnamed protein product [Macrosiphum euphorbiae]|uniref:Uncharacterized protein n=1 Tax=Macrosiphum euphorbiae TaxID=13131 RepID=A0AAV0XTH0_9HEMI|nr:unnamed protein product [Macrosiphum euphorbiae]
MYGGLAGYARGPAVQVESNAKRKTTFSRGDPRDRSDLRQLCLQTCSRAGSSLSRRLGTASSDVFSDAWPGERTRHADPNGFACRVFLPTQDLCHYAPTPDRRRARWFRRPSRPGARQRTARAAVFCHVGGTMVVRVLRLTGAGRGAGRSG